MKRQGSGIRDHESESMERLLQRALPRIEDHAGLSHDLWPAMLRRLDAESVPAMVRIPWFDWALMGGLAAMVVAFPGAIPMLLYYL